MSLSSVFGRKADPVQFMLNKVGVDVSSRSYVDKPLAVAESVTHSAKSLEFIHEAKMALAAQRDNNGPAANDPSFQAAGGSSLLKNPVLQQATELGVVAAVTAINPVAGAVLGAGFAMKNGVQSMFSANSQDMSTVHAGTINTAIDGGGTLGLSYGLHDKKGKASTNDETYTDIMGDSWTMSGQKASTPPVVQTTAQPLINPLKMAAAAGLAREKFSDREIDAALEGANSMQRDHEMSLGTGLRKLAMMPPAVNAPQFRMMG